MATSAPPPVDCPILQFKQLCKLKTCSDRSKRVYKKPSQLIATSSLYGLTFIGEVSGLKIIISSQIFENLNGLNPKNVVKSYIHRNIPLPSAPSHIDVNSDQQFLSVTYCRNESPFLRVYEIRMLLADTPVVFSEVRLSPGNEYVTDLAWNPAVPNMLTCCISDRTLSVYTFNPNGSFEIKTLPKESNSLCVCWSPKGKQLVVGNDNGYLTQYLPELKAMKNFPPPSNIFDKPCRLCSIKWLSNFQFIGVYELQRPNEEDGDPQTSVIIINTPKNEPVSFINYDDICFSSGVERPCQFYFTHIASWNMIFVASSNAVEVAVLKQQQDSVSWCQWTLEDSARITLPMSGVNDTFPVGISVDYSSTIQCPIGENFVPMPIISVLSCEGILCLYVVNYLVPNAPNICVKPSIDPQLTYFTNNDVSEEEVIPAQPTTPVANVTAFSSSQPANLSNELVTVTPVSKPADIVDVPSASPNLSPSIDAVSHFVQQSLESATSAPLNQHITLNQTVTYSTMPINQKPKEIPPLTKITYASSAVAHEPTSVSKSDMQAKARQECLARFKKASSTFESDISEIKGLIDHISIEDDGHVMPNARLKKLQTDTKRLMKLKSELTNEVDAIKVSLVEVFACIQDIKTKYVQLTNPSYRTLLGAQELDPVNATSLKNIENNINYVESQLEKANQQLDEFWCKYNEHSSPTRMKIPILDNVYETMMRQQKILKILESQAEKIQKRITAVKCQAKSNQWMQNKKDLSTFASRAFDDLTLAEFTQKALTIKGDYNEDLASSDAKTLARKFSLEHARRFHISNSKLLKLQELHGGISVTNIQSSRLQRLKKKSLILLSKSAFTNDSVTEDDGEVAAEIARAPVRQNSEEMRLPLVSPVSSDGDYVADQASALGYPSSLSIVSSTPVKDFNKYVAPRFPASEPSISVEVSLPLPATAKTPSLFSAPKTESDRLFASATITLPSQSKPKVGQSPIVSPLAASGAAATVAVTTVGVKPSLATPTTTKDAQSYSIFKNFTTSTGASTESTSKPLFGGEVTITPVGGSGDDATSSAFSQMPSLFAKSPPTASSLATTSSLATASGGSFFGSLMGTSTTSVSTPTSFFSNATAASVGAATSSAPVSIFSGSKLGSSGGNLFGGLGTPSSNPPAVSSAPKVSPFSSNNLNVSPSNATSGLRITPGVATSPAKSNVTASPAVSTSASVVVTSSAASTIFGGTGSIFDKGSLPATSTINFGSILPSANSALANKPQQATAVSNDKKTSAFSTFSFSSKRPENTSVTVTEVPPDSPSEGSDADKENTVATVPTAVSIGGTANSGSAAQGFSFAKTAFASAKQSIFSTPLSSTATPAPSFTPTANVAPMPAATEATATPDTPSLLSSILSTNLATPATNNSVSEGSLFQSVPAASEASLPTAAATSASAVTITPIMTRAPAVTTPGIEPVTPEPSPTAENTLPTVLEAGATSPTASAFESKGTFFEGLNLGATTTTSASTSIFGKPATGNSMFGGNLFGQSAGQGSAAVETKSIFGSSSLFGTSSATSPESQNLFGAAGNAPFSENQTSIFGSSSVFGSTSTFGNASVNAAPQANAFGSSSGGMLFSGGATTGFSPSSTSIFQNNAAGFGSPASFGGNMPQAQSAGGFGSPPSFSSAFTKSSYASFGGAATFGGAPAFGGSPTKVFGQAEPNQAAFGNAASPQSAAFENLATENTMSFGNLAQQQSPGFGSPPSFNQQPPSFSQPPSFGGSSFSNWR